MSSIIARSRSIKGAELSFWSSVLTWSVSSVFGSRRGVLGAETPIAGLLWTTPSRRKKANRDRSAESARWMLHRRGASGRSIQRDYSGSIDDYYYNARSDEPASASRGSIPSSASMASARDPVESAARRSRAIAWCAWHRHLQIGDRRWHCSRIVRNGFDESYTRWNRARFRVGHCDNGRSKSIELRRGGIRW